MIKRKFKIFDYTNDKFLFRGKPFAATNLRLAAYLTDIILLSVISLLFQLILVFFKGEFPYDWLDKGLIINLWILVSVSLPAWIYFTFYDMSEKGGTIGKRIFGLQLHHPGGVLYG